jgi:RNA 3'-terminal phosphate cyclase (ATP)
MRVFWDASLGRTMDTELGLDGSHGEGGGQILRTALTLSALTGRALRLERIRAGRSKPGLQPQHLAVVRAMIGLCAAQVEGDSLNSSTLTFVPGAVPQAGNYVLDISALAGTGSAGAVTLLFQAVWLPLALAAGHSTLTLIGGTHVPWSPPYHYLTEIYLPIMRRMGFKAQMELERWGWYPHGGGQVRVEIEGLGPTPRLVSLDLMERGKLSAVWGLSAASHLPEHVVQRQRERALQRLRARHLKADIELVDAPAAGPGTVLFMVAQYAQLAAGFSGYGKLRYPAEKVADDALDAFETYHMRKAALDPHLADQVLLPLALVPGPSRYTTSEITRHLLTNCWVIQQFLAREIVIEGREGEPGIVRIS